MTNVVTIDFETEEIIGGSPVPPKPVGVALKINAKTSKYWAWGHPIENNCRRSEARTQIKEALAHANHVVFHNAKFDLLVMSHWLDIRLSDNNELFDTMVMAFLVNPHEKSLGLKNLGATILNMPAGEQQDLRDWILKYVDAAKDTSWGAHIAKAPAKLVGKYAQGDTDRTYKLYQLFYKTLDKDHQSLRS